MTNIATANKNPSTSGIVLHAAHGYDLLVWIFTLGRERSFREKMLRLAHLKPGESVLDVGCGTGTLAIAARQQVGMSGKIFGVDASPEMLARAEKKSKKAGAGVAFKNAFAQSLPFPDAAFDVVTNTMMLHHLPQKARQELGREIRRVLKPGGRALIVDFGPRTGGKQGFFSHLHRRSGVALEEIAALLGNAGLHITESGDIGMRDLHYVVATAPDESKCCAG